MLSTMGPSPELGFAPQEIRNSTVKWRAIFAGVFVAFMTYLILTSLGVAVGGATLKGVVAGSGKGTGLSIGSGIWLVVSVLISLYTGSYMASRASGQIVTRVGTIQGIVIAALFFVFMISQIAGFIGTLGSGLGSVVGSAGGAASDLASNPQVQSVVQDGLGGLNLKSPPDQVARGVATRLIQGDGNGAKNYLAAQAGISPAQADQRIGRFLDQFQARLKDIGASAAKAVSIAGWTLFVLFTLGTVFSALGGAAGAVRNLMRPVSDQDQRRLSRQKVA